MHKNDEQWMRQALELAVRGARTAAPNPMVGAVVVRDGVAVGEGFHQRAGEDHAEVAALKAAGEAARGATLYVTLEPCCHHGRTGPCTEALIAAGVRRVVAGVRDPYPPVSGKGLARLRQARVRVKCPVLEADCARLNRAFFSRVTRSRPWVTLKLATTLDGKVATRSGDSKWITSEATRAWVHDLRARVNAILVGIGTVESDDPLLTARPLDPTGLRQPLRIVLDTHCRLSGQERVCKSAGEGPVLQVVAESPRDPLPGVERLVLATPAGGIDVPALMAELARREINHLLVEGGSRVAGAFHDAGLVDEYIFCIAPKLVGDPLAIPALSGGMLTRMSDAVMLDEVEVARSGGDVIISGLVKRG